jgi:hypothetical protein
MIIWYPHPPVADVALSIPPRVGGSSLGFRCGRLTIKVDQQALIQARSSVGLQRAWRRISLVVQPFYGDVRTLGGFSRRRGRYWSDARTDSHPVCGWWWAGIPCGPVCAVVLGDPYCKLWPSFCQHAETKGGLCFVSSSDWQSGRNMLAEIGSSPHEIAQPEPETEWSLKIDRKYPQSWPFDPPRSER